MNPPSGALLTDLYQLTMLQTYVEQGMEEPAVFEFFIRKLPPRRNFLLAAGLEQALEYLETLRFTDRELDWLKTGGRFPAPFVDYLARLRFTGDVHAMPEGTVFFPDEPVLRVIAPLPQAQLVETRLINLLHFQTVIASKAARLVLLAQGKPLIDFGLRRAHGAEAGTLAARAGYLAGFAGTATVSAGVQFGVPVYGTMAHSFVQAHVDETESFERFAKSHPDNVVLLLDTYDTEAAAGKVTALAPRLTRQGITIKGVRLDSGDLADHARKVRRILDAGGLPHVTIVASGNIDEAALRRLVEVKAPIDLFAVGTHVTTSSDAPYADCAYKLQEYAGRPCRKRSEGKATWPGRKQVYRQYGPDGRMAGDVITLEGDRQEGTALVQPVMQGGKRLAPPRPLADMRAATAAELSRLPEPLRTLQDGASYPVQISRALQVLAASVDQGR
jgi:nicotinate phosphoribosyltransferase